jgi:hypothetical protein
MGRKFEIGIRELDHRRHDGIDVTLFWDPRTNAVFIAVDDERAGNTFEFDVDAVDALEAFRHPYAYAHADDGDRALAA